MKKFITNCHTNMIENKKNRGWCWPRCRNAARALGGAASWEKRQARELFGEEAMETALTMHSKDLEPIKKILVDFFESQFTELDWEQEKAIKRQAEAFRRGEDSVGLEDCDL